VFNWNSSFLNQGIRKAFIEEDFPVADDVDQSHIELFKEHKEVGTDGMAATFINSKGFGGNNASALVLSPQMTEQLLDKRYSRDQKLAYKRNRENVVAEANEYNLAALKGLTRPIYQFGKDIVAGEDLEVTAESISVPGFAAPIKLREENFFADLSVSH
jgi:acetoacetyl-[acyl-carrier protein] synthase